MNRWFRLWLAGALTLLFVGAAALSSAPPNAGAVGCRTATASPADPYPGTTAATSNFESGAALAGFTAFTSGTGTAAVSAAYSRSANCALFLHTTADPGSIAKMTVGLPAGMTEVYADGWFNINAEGVEGNNVPYFRVFSGGVRIMDVFRQNLSRDLVLRVTSPTGFVYVPLGPTVRLGTWHHVVMHVVPNGPATGVQIWWDGRSVFASNSVNISANTADMVQLGSEHDQQMGDIYADDVVINSGSGTPGPIPGTLPAPIPDPSKWLNDFDGDGKADVVAQGTTGGL